MKIRVRCTAACLAAVFGVSVPAMAQRSGGLTTEFLKTYGLSAEHVASQLDFSPLVVDSAGGTEEIKSGPMLKDEASELLLRGNQPLSMELYFAHMVTEYEQAQAELQSVAFSPLLRRPVWNIGWGVSMSIRGGTADEANPIGGSGPSGSASGRGSSGRGNEAIDSNASSELHQALGLVADVVADEFKERVSQGHFGAAMNALVIVNSDESVAAQQQGFRPGVRRQDDNETTRDSAPSVLGDAPEPPPMWQTGIIYLGQGASTDKAAEAIGMGLDLLLHFDVLLKSGRDDEIQNTSRCRVIQVSDGKTLGVSKGMEREDAARFSRGGKGGDEEYIKEQLDVVLSVIDQKTKVTKMPELTADVAKKRVGALLSYPRLSGARKPSLRTLAEIRMYQSLGLLDASDVEAAFDYVGGDDGLFLLYGPLDERLERARRWAVDAQAGGAP